MRKKRYRRCLSWPFLAKAFKFECPDKDEFIFYSHSSCFRATTPIQDRLEATRWFDTLSLGCWQATLVSCNKNRLPSPPPVRFARGRFVNLVRLPLKWKRSENRQWRLTHIRAASSLAHNLKYLDAEEKRKYPGHIAAIPGLVLIHSQVNRDKNLLNLLDRSTMRAEDNLNFWHDISISL